MAALLRGLTKQRHAELGSASIVPRGPEGLEAKWTLNQVQGDEAVKAATQSSHPIRP
jgi:hypothetical protein